MKAQGNLTYICSTNAAVKARNISSVLRLQKKIVRIKAINSSPTAEDASYKTAGNLQNELFLC